MLLIVVMILSKVTQENLLLNPDLLSIQPWAKLLQLIPKRIFHIAFEWSCSVARDRLSSPLPLERGERREAWSEATDTISLLSTSDQKMNNKLGKMNADLGLYQRTERFQRINKDVRSDGTSSPAYCGGCLSTHLGTFTSLNLCALLLDHPHTGESTLQYNLQTNRAGSHHAARELQPRCLYWKLVGWILWGLWLLIPPGCSEGADKAPCGLPST